MSKQGKITVKHYLNTNLKPYIIDNEKYYKIYVLIRANTQNTKVKSEISNNEYTENEFNNLISDKSSEINKYIKIETEIINNIVTKIHTDNKRFTSKLYTEYSKKYKITIGELIMEINYEKSKKEKYKSFEQLYEELIKEDSKTDEQKKQEILNSKYVSIGSNYIQITNDLINIYENILPINYELNDLFVIQWQMYNIKTQFENYLKKIKNLDIRKYSHEYTENLSTHINRYINT